MATPAASGSGLIKLLRPASRPHSTDLQAAVFWGVAAGTTALWIVQVPPISTSVSRISIFTPLFNLHLYYLLCVLYVIVLCGVDLASHFI
ncbi:ubiquinol-cytochrome c reductase complex 6.7 kDa protein [Phtheirospermum japonicum]|uniref:Ubiquinol-cytochrome c reductase complex 6.7 kDa protein n=1 Tax=Phtheirospermum japonicum TaxID=374723 RepID=A0A830D709_9LAMI|nr:ubiquinol-cytochrome c reductase complex 6.7 kDa protein [Phtheirospermum japonicum]